MMKEKKRINPASERARGIRIPGGDYHAVATRLLLGHIAKAGKHGAAVSTMPSVRLLLGRIAKAGEHGAAVSAVAGSRYARWLLRCLVKAKLVKLVPGASKRKSP